MSLIAYRVPKRLEDNLIFMCEKTCLCAHPSKPYVFLFLFSEYDLEDADLCVVTNTGKKSGIEAACGLLSQIHVVR